MRPFAFISSVLLCNLYGLAFDLVASNRAGGIVCDLLGADSCLLTQPVDYWLSAVSLLLLLPVAGVLLANWLSGGLRLVKSSAFLGLLLLTP